MPTYLTPGTYVEGIPSVSPAPVAGAPTAVPAFVGLAPGGPQDTPLRVTSWNQFATLFGDPADPGNGPFAAGAYLAHAVFGFFTNGGQVCWVVRVGDDVEGDLTRRTGLQALAAVDEVTIVCTPDLAVHAEGDDPYAFQRLQFAATALCEAAGDRIAILDAPPGLGPGEISDWIYAAGYESRHATLYWPWITIMDPLTVRPIAVPPCGHVAGAWARSDLRRGIHKAPANEVLLGVHDLEYAVTASEQGRLNMVGVNCLRAFPGRGIRIWGARTLSSEPEWRYVNHVRLVAFVSRSLSEGISWATFEPNDPALWVQLRVAAASFLTRLWRDGALLGATPEEAFFVRCDETLNTPEQVDAGQVVIEVGIALVRPAEFVVFRLAQTGALW